MLEIPVQCTNDVCASERACACETIQQSILQELWEDFTWICWLRLIFANMVSYLKKSNYLDPVDPLDILAEL